MTLESTPAQKKAFSTFYAGQKAGTNKPMVDTASQRPDKMMASAISAKLRGETPTTDTPDAPAGVDPAVWSRAQASAADPQSPEYDLASALLDLAQQLADLKGTQA
jgi:hypothetical protein